MTACHCNSESFKAALASLVEALPRCRYCFRAPQVSASKLTQAAVTRIGTSGPTSWGHCDAASCRRRAVNDVLDHASAPLSADEVERIDLDSAGPIRAALVLLERAE